MAMKAKARKRWRELNQEQREAVIQTIQANLNMGRLCNCEKCGRVDAAWGVAMDVLRVAQR